MTPHYRPTFQGQNIAELLAESAAGLAITGDSDSGKSNLMLLLFDELIRSGVGATLIDPHGDLARDAEQACAALPSSVRDRVVIVRPSDLGHIAPLNPLAVPRLADNPYAWRAQVAAKVSHVTRILLAAWGEKDTNSKPVLFKWMTRALTTLATAGMTIPDARHFFQVGGEVYQALARAVPDLMARVEMAELLEMRPRDREELIASTKNRFLGFLANPVMDLVLGRPGGWLDATALLRNRSITIVSLERGGVLRDEDVEIFANLWLAEILFAAYNLPRHERQPHVVLLDELPVFASSFDLLTRALGQVRKFLIRIIGAFQGAQFFPDRTDDRLLHALISQCRTTVVLRHKNPADARFFGELVTLPTIEPLTVKHQLIQEQQYQDGHDLVYLTDESTQWSAARQDGGSHADSVNASSTDSNSRNESQSATDSLTQQEQSLAQSVSQARAIATGTGSSHAATQGTSATDTASWSRTVTHGGSATRKATLVPRMFWRKVVTSVQFYSPDEMLTLGARDITRFATGEGILSTAGSAPARVRFPLAPSPFAQTPKFAAKKLGALHKAVHALPLFASPDRIIAERQAFESRLIEHLETLIDSASISNPRALAPPDNNPLLTI